MTKWRAVTNKAINLRIPYIAENLLTFKTFRTALLHAVILFQSGSLKGKIKSLQFITNELKSAL